MPAGKGVANLPNVRQPLGECDQIWYHQGSPCDPDFYEPSPKGDGARLLGIVPASPCMFDLILGTAGHIDHGKTALVKALTGRDTDRLPEEKKRGITIELGFAELVLGDYRLGIVDVPGHERFVRQMLAGATGMDLAMLVVAADDSVKPQTREHMDVLRMLDVRHGVIVLTKCDLASPDWVELVEQEVRELAEGSFLEKAPVIRTSAVTQAGLPELRRVLQGVAATAYAELPADWEQVPFRMAVDRAFSLPGHGTIVTGSVASGRTATGDMLELQPVGTRVRVRTLHNHDREVDFVHRGQRAAINLAGAELAGLQRGSELASLGYLRPSHWVTVRLHALSNCPRPIKHRSRVRVHLGTTEMLASLSLLDALAVSPGGEAWGQLYFPQSVACLWNQPFVLRAESPLQTIGGGRILVPVADKLRRPTECDRLHLQELRSSDLDQRLAAAIYFCPLTEGTRHDGFRLAGVLLDEERRQRMLESGRIIRLVRSADAATVVHPDTLRQHAQQVTQRLERLHERDPLVSMFELTRVTNGLDYLGDEAYLKELLQWMSRQQSIRVSNGRAGLTDRQPQISPAQMRLLAELAGQHEQAGLEPPTMAELQQQFARQARELPKLLDFLISDGTLVRINRDFCLHVRAEQQLRAAVTDALTQRSPLTLSEIREHLGTSRKYAVPFCEYLDRTGVTQRRGDIRTLAAQ